MVDGWILMGYLEGVQFYDLFTTEKEQEQAFYQQLAQKVGSPALELGVGTGIFAFLLAKDGINVVGIDNSPFMLTEARNKLQQAPEVISNRLTFLEGDMADFQLDQTFRLIYIPSGSFQHLETHETQINCLQCVCQHLHPDGLFVFDVWVGHIETSGVWRRLETVPLSEGGAVIRSISTRVLEVPQLVDTVLRFDVHDSKGKLQKTFLDSSRLAILTVEVVQKLLDESEFQVNALYSSFSGNLWESGADRAIFVTSRKST